MKAIAIKFVSAFKGIEIFDTPYERGEQYVIWKWTDEKKKHKSIIYYTAKGKPFFKRNGTREYLDDFMRTDRY